MSFTCREQVGSADDWVEKTHVPTDGETWQRRWLDSTPIRTEPVPAEKRDGLRWAIIVDVEGKSDIIELPAIVLDLEAGCEVLRFHRWVFVRKPMKHTNPKSNAVPLQKALQEFVEALRSIPTFDESRALMVHCGDFDAKMLMKAWEKCAQYSNFCDALSFDLPDLFQKWCNVKDLVFNAVVRTTSNEEEQEALAEKMDGMNRLASFLQVPRPENSNLTLHHLGMYDTDSREALLLIIVYYCKL